MKVNEYLCFPINIYVYTGSYYTNITSLMCFLQLTNEQTKTLQEAFKSPMSLREHGLFFLDQSYTCVRADKTSIYAKKVCHFVNWFITSGTGWIYIHRIHNFEWIYRVGRIRLGYCAHNNINTAGCLFRIHVPQHLCRSHWKAR